MAHLEDVLLDVSDGLEEEAHDEHDRTGDVRRRQDGVHSRCVEESHGQAYCPYPEHLPRDEYAKDKRVNIDGGLVCTAWAQPGAPS